MIDPGLLDVLERSCHELLEWVGFGTLTGLAAKGLMPGRDPGGAVGTMLMGIAGCIMGCGTLMFFIEDAKVTPISPVGFLAAIGGAFIILLFYRILAGRMFVESEGDGTLHRSTRRRRRRQLSEA